MLNFVLLTLLFYRAGGQNLADVLKEVEVETQGDDRNRIPTKVWLEASEDEITVHWAPPIYLIDANFCTVAYEAKNNPIEIRIPVTKDQRMYVIRGLKSETLYQVRLFCYYGGAIGPSTKWFKAATRTVSVMPSVCAGSLPNAILEPYCLARPSYRGICEFTCQDGYRKSDVPAVIRGYRSRAGEYSVFLSCVNGTWTTYNEDYGYEINNICLPEAEFQRCPTSIPNGKLEPRCGPATDWLCNFECNDGFYKHSYMSGRLKGFNDKEYLLYCDNGIWKTGYEELGVDVSGVCYADDNSCTSSDGIPHGKVLALPCPSGYCCSFKCDPGYHKHPLVWDSPNCENGVWSLRTTKYDSLVTPETLCISDDVMSICPQTIPNGRIADPNCTENCWPDCNEGYYVPGRNGPALLFCEAGKWLTDEWAYNGDNICFPEGGHLCSLEIPNGISAEEDYWRADDGTSRQRLNYKCSEGFRRHRTISHIECVAGTWLTWQERFGLNTSSLCIPLGTY